MSLEGAEAEAAVGAETINEFLDNQSQNTLSRLYRKPASCLAIYRLLPMLARQLIMHMLFLDGPILLDDVKPWIRKDGTKLLQAALTRLDSLSIVKEKLGKLVMSDIFQEGMRRALTGGGDHRSFGVPCDTPDPDAVSVEFLDQYARRGWEDILHYMVGSDSTTTPPRTVLDLLRFSALMQESDSGLVISSRGFQFLLEDINTQLWYLLLQYLSLAESRDMDLVDVLSFLFVLGSLELGRDYSIGELTETQLRMIDDFVGYGLIYRHDASSPRFYPTRLATTLTSNAAPLKSATQQEEEREYIIFETNYRLYAYTSNPLRIAILNLFTTIRSRFPNLIVGAITRGSVKRALANGITADQILAYLSHHAHEQMMKNDPLLPVTVSDQIRLWEREKNRMVFEEGVLFTDFTSSADFELVRNYAQQLGVLLWQNEMRRIFFVTAEGHPSVRDFIKRRLT